MVEEVLNFIDTIQTVTPKGSFYHSKDERVLELLENHRKMLALDEELYFLCLFYPGINDYNKLTILKNILSSNRLGKQVSALVSKRASLPSTKIVDHSSFRELLRETTYPRVLRFFLDLRRQRVNNKRTQKTILSFILGDKNILGRSLRYRKKMRMALEHAYGKKVSTTLMHFARKYLTERDKKSQQYRYLKRNILKYSDDVQEEKILEIFLFLFKADFPYTIKEYIDFEEAKKDITRGFDLPYDLLIGIRNQHHKHVDLKMILEKTKDRLTDTQKLTLQTKARDLDVAVKVDFSRFDMVRLYKYALEKGLTDEIEEALEAKAGKIAQQFRLGFGRAALIIDNSLSMAGSEEQKNDPLARVLSIGKIIECSSSECIKFFTSPPKHADLPFPGGSTSIAGAVLQAARENPDIICILSDGYENSPEGLTHIVLEHIKRLGIQIPVVHFNPGFAVESSRIKTLSEHIITLPVSDVQNLTGTFIRYLIEKKHATGIEYLKHYLMLSGMKVLGLPDASNVTRALEEKLTTDLKAVF